MGDTLHIASQKAAYTLTDDGTYLAQRSTLDLAPYAEGANDLRNIYHVIVVKPIAGRVGNLAGAEAFAGYIVSPEGQHIIAVFGKERFGRPLFTCRRRVCQAVPKRANIERDHASRLRHARLASPWRQRSIAACFALPGALWIVYGRSRQRMVLLGVFNVGLGLPPVAVGLAVAFTFWRSGPLGWLGLCSIHQWRWLSRKRSLLRRLWARSRSLRCAPSIHH